MTASVREAGPFERLVSFELSNDDIDAAKVAAARRLSKDLKLKGFRPGKAPRPVVEAAVGKERLRSEAIEEAIPPKLTEVLRSEDILPAVTPSLEKMNDVEGGVEVEVKITVWPTLDQVPAYRDRRVELESPEVTDEDVDGQLERMREQFGQVEEVERAAGEGDFVSVDISAAAAGQPLEEASATELLYRIGTGGLIEGADDALIGTTAGDVVTVTAPLPEGFGEATEAEFTITVNEVKELVLPDLTDEWVDGNTEFDTVDELKTTLHERIGGMKRSALVRQFNDRALEGLVEQVELELPEAIVRAEMDDLLHRFLHQLEEQEVSFADYLAATGLTEQHVVADVQNQATHGLITRLLLDAVARDAELDVTDEEVSQILQSAAAQSEDPARFLQAIQGTTQELSLRSDMLRDKALRMIVENATPVDPDGNEIDLPETEDSAVEGQVVEGELVEGEVVEGEVVEGEIVEAEPVDASEEEE
ncbi:trigger factor [soil metagenome]